MVFHISAPHLLQSTLTASHSGVKTKISARILFTSSYSHASAASSALLQPVLPAQVFQNERILAISSFLSVWKKEGFGLQIMMNREQTSAYKSSAGLGQYSTYEPSELRNFSYASRMEWLASLVTGNFVLHESRVCAKQTQSVKRVGRIPNHRKQQHES